MKSIDPERENAMWRWWALFSLYSRTLSLLTVLENMAPSALITTSKTTRLARDRRCELPAGLNWLRRGAPRQGLYPHVHSVDPGVSGNLVGQ